MIKGGERQSKLGDNRVEAEASKGEKGLANVALCVAERRGGRLMMMMIRSLFLPLPPAGIA